MTTMEVFTWTTTLEASSLEEAATELDVEDLMKEVEHSSYKPSTDGFCQSQSLSWNFSQQQESHRSRNRRCGNDSWRSGSNFLRCSLFLFGLICTNVSGTGGLKINSSGGYEDVVVTIGNDVPPISCQQVVQNLQGILTSTSESLHYATKGKVYFHRVIIVLPPMWDARGCGKILPPTSFTSLSSISTAEFRVNGEHPIFGHSPFTQQSQGCSKGGDFISVGYKYIMQHNETEAGSSTPDRAFVHEWAKFRYGVFEEKGLERDPIYPLLYHDGDGAGVGRMDEERKSTSCTNRPLKGIWTGICNGTGLNCVFIPSLTENDNVTSSIMSVPNLPHVKSFCDGGTHKPLAPTKHNFMCRQKSVEEVIFSHPDFRNIIPGSRNEKGVSAPHFVIKQLTQPRFVMLVEETGNMNLRDVWKYLKLAIRKFVKYDLPTGTQIGLMTVSTDVRLLANMTTLVDDNNVRGTLAEKLPNYPNIQGQGFSLRKGISQAINMLKLNGQRVSGSVIILISQGTVSTIDLEASLQLLRQEEVSITTIEYPSVGDGKISFLSQGTNSPHYSIRETGVGTMSHMSTYIQLVNSLMDIQRFFTKGIAARWPTLIHQEEFKGDAPSFVKSSFSYDSSQTPGVFYIYVPNPIDPKVNTVELTSPTGTKYTDQLSYLHDINVIKIDAQIDQPGIWRYRIQRLGDSHQSHFVQVLTSGGNTEDLTVRLFSNVEETRTVNLANMPLILYAELKRGSSPVLGADVVALVNGNWSVSLLDNGNGDPDLTKGDGVYSRYIIPAVASQTAWLDITVKVETTPYRSRFIGPDTSGAKFELPPSCCGSGLRLPSPSSLRTMPYNERVVYSYVIKVLNAQDPGTYPPSRIGNLRVVQSFDTRVMLEFTSPGDDYDQGLPHKYKISWSDTRRMLPFRTEDIMATSQAGSTVNLTISLPGYKLYFLSVVAVDRGHRSGERSNIVEVRTTPPPSDNTDNHGVAGNSELQMNGDTSRNEGGTDGDSGLSTTQLILIVAGAVGFLLLIAAIIICIYCRRRSTKGMGSTDTKISTISDTKAPIHWSASELLQEHEKRQSIYAQSNQSHPHHPTTYGYNGVQNPGGGRHHEGGGSPGSSTRSFRSISENRKTSLDSMSGRRATLTDYESCSSDPTVKSVKGQTDYDTCPDSDQDNYRTIDSYPIHPPPYKVPAGGIMSHYPQRVINSHNSHLQYNPNLQGSLTSVNSKKRNITMV